MIILNKLDFDILSHLKSKLSGIILYNKLVNVPK